MQSCKTGLGQGLCVWGAGLVASIVLATNANAYFGTNGKGNLESVSHINSSMTTDSKFKMSVEAEGSGVMLGVGDSRSLLTPETKFYIEDVLGTYPENYWY